MSTSDTRAQALAAAIQTLGGSAGADEVLIAAVKFEAFLTGVLTGVQTAETPQQPAGSKKPATGAKKPTKSEEEVVKAALEKQRAEAEAAGADGNDGDEPTGDAELTEDEDVRAVIARMLAANKRKEAIALLKKFGAASAKGVKAADITKFIAAALKIVGTTSEEDLTA